MVSRVIPVDAFDLVISGVTGDLARRKILPGLFHRFLVGQMPENAQVIGSSRTQMDDGEFREMVRASLQEFSPQASGDTQALDSFLDKLRFVRVDATGDDGWQDHAAKLRPDAIRAFYLSVSPALFGAIATNLEKHGVSTAEARIVVEKPFGHDLESAKALNADLRRSFDERQIYRIDHYLGKETVHNLMALRFANSLWEPLWNSTHIDHVQITVAGSLGVKGRGEYYDRSGAMRDEKVKVIAALKPVAQADTVRGQYRAQNGDDSYRDDAGDPESPTESFVAMKVNVGNRRWASKPFYLRTGKKLRARASEIAMVFRDPPNMMFPKMEGRRGNALTIRLQPDEGITLRTTIKDPGPWAHAVGGSLARYDV